MTQAPPLSSRLRLARAALWWESRAPAVTLILSLAALALALALLDVAPRLPAWLHLLVLAGLAGGIVAAIRHARRLPHPTEDEAARRLEAESGQVHRPLAAIRDSLAQGDGELWQAYLRRMEDEAARLRPGWPRPVMAAKDPYALRFAALLLLAVAAAGGRADWNERLERFFHPAVEVPGLGPSMLEVWIAPPPHTALPAMALKRSDTPAAVAIPAGSRAKAAISGGLGGAVLRAGETEAPFTEGEAQLVIAGGSELAVEQGWRTVARWPITVVRDALPKVALAAPPEADDRGRLRLRVQASDDYGLARLWMEVRPNDGSDDTLEAPLALPGERPRETDFSPRIDLAAHDWAGHPVRLIPWAEDGAGQKTAGEVVALTLPERVFRHPVARALIRWRREAGDSPRLGPEIAARLGEVLADPDVFGGDMRVFLTLALTQRLLAAERFERWEVRDLLWSAATRLDDGAVAAAEQELEQARHELEQTLAANASPQRLAELVDRLEAALERWMRALAESGTVAEGPAGADAITDQDLEDMMGTLRGLAETGDREALRRRLADLADTLSRLGEAGRAAPPDPKALAALNRLRDLTRRQQEMQDKSFRKSPPPPSEDDEDENVAPAAHPNKADRAEARRAARDQMGLKDDLARLLKDLPHPPNGLKDAGRAMGDAAAALERGDWPLAGEAQGEALRLLRDGARDMAQGMEARRGKDGVMRDPFGRSGAGTINRDDGATKIPDRSESRRAREILEELRRRAGDPRRPETEIDYLKRLLKQF